MSFIVKEVAISEDLLGCVSESEAHIFQVILNPHLLKATSEEKETKEQEKRSKSRSKTRSASRSPGRSSSDSFSSSSRLRGRWPSQKEEITGSFIRNADDYTDLSQLIWVPTLSYGHKRPTDDRHFLLFPSLVGAAHCGPVAEPGEVIGPSKEDPNWSDQRAALKELYAPRPSYLNLLPPFNVESSNEKKTEKNSTDDGGSSEIKGDDVSSTLLHLLVLQSLLSSELPSIEDRANVLKFATTNPGAIGSYSLHVLCLESTQQMKYVMLHFPLILLQYGKACEVLYDDLYESPIEWTDLVNALINHKASLSLSDPSYQVYVDVLNDVLSDLVVSSPLDVFLRIIPSTNHEELRNYIRQCHSAALATYLRSSLITYADNVLAQMAK